MRIVVVGTSGSGKSTLAAALAQRLHCPHLELDALYWGPDWTPRSQADFIAAVDAASRGERWVADGNYSPVRELLWGRASHVIWLNYPLPLPLWRVCRRTLSRVLRHQPLWGGNRETLRRALLSRDSILLWALTSHGKNRSRYAALHGSRQFPHLQWLELRRPMGLDAVLRRL